MVEGIACPLALLSIAALLRLSSSCAERRIWAANGHHRARSSAVPSAWSHAKFITQGTVIKLHLQVCFVSVFPAQASTAQPFMVDAEGTDGGCGPQSKISAW